MRHGAQILPANERQTRPLVALPPQKQQEAWAKAISSAPSGRVTSTYVAQVAKEYQQNSDEDTYSETGSAAGSSTPAVPQGDTAIAQTGSNEVRAYWCCYWNIEVSVSEVSKYKVTANTEALLNFQNKLLLLEEVHGI